MENTNLSEIISTLRITYGRNSLSGLYYWLTRFDILLKEKNYQDCCYLLSEIRKGGFPLICEELQAINEREYGLYYKRDGIESLALYYKKELNRADPGEVEKLADLLYGSGLLCYKQGNHKIAVDCFNQFKSQIELLKDDKKAGRANKVLFAMGSDKETRISVMEPLWEEAFYPGRTPVKILDDILWYSSWTLKRKAATALSEISAFPELETALKQHPDPGTRRDIIMALSSLNTYDKTPLLIAGLADEFWQVRWQAARQLSRFSNTKAIESLVTMAFKDKDMDVRMAAIETLGSIGSRKIKSELQNLIKKLEKGDLKDSLDHSLCKRARSFLK